MWRCPVPVGIPRARASVPLASLGAPSLVGFVRALLARLRPLHNTRRPPSHVRSCPLSLWERVGERVFRATTPGLCKVFRWLSLAPFLLSWALRPPALSLAPGLPLHDRSRPRSRAGIPSARVAAHPFAARRPWARVAAHPFAARRPWARVAAHPFAARRPSAPWRCAPSPQSRVNPAKNPAKTLPRQPVPLRGTGWRGRVPPLIPHPPARQAQVPAPIMAAPPRQGPPK